MEITKHPLFCIRTATIINYRYNLKCNLPKNKTNSECASSSSPFNRLYDYLLHYIGIGKSIFYTLSLVLIMRALYCAVLLHFDKSGRQPREVLAPHLSYNPLVVFCVHQFKFIRPSIIACISLAGAWALYFDYAFTYSQNASSLQMTHQLMVANGQHFWALNERLLGGGKDVGWAIHAGVSQWPASKWLPQMLRLLCVYHTLLRRLWTATKEQSVILRFVKTPILDNFSKHLRGLLILHNAAYEAGVVILNIIAGSVFSPNNTVYFIIFCLHSFSYHHQCPQ